MPSPSVPSVSSVVQLADLRGPKKFNDSSTDIENSTLGVKNQHSGSDRVFRRSSGPFVLIRGIGVIRGLFGAIQAIGRLADPRQKY